MDHDESLPEFLVRKQKELQLFADWYRKQQGRTKDDYPEVQKAGDWEDQFLTYLPELS